MTTSRRKGFFEKLLDFKDLELLQEDFDKKWKIYKAKCVVSNGIVSLKSYALNSAISRQLQLSIQQEIELTSEASCPFIVHSFDDFIDAGQWWIVQEYCSGSTLANILHSYEQDIEEGWVVSQVVFLMLQTLDFLHQKDTVHCALSPENIVFNSGRVAKLTGFQYTQNEGTAIETCSLEQFAYSAPELLQESSSSAILTHKADVWSLGVIAYEIIFGITPFLHVNSTTHKNNILTKQLEFPWEVSKEFEEFICQALSRDAAQRPTAAKLLLHPWIQTNINWEPSSEFEDPVETTMVLQFDEDENEALQEDLKNSAKQRKASSFWMFCKQKLPSHNKQSSKIATVQEEKEESLLHVVTDPVPSHDTAVSGRASCRSQELNTESILLGKDCLQLPETSSEYQLSNSACSSGYQYKNKSSSEVKEAVITRGSSNDLDLLSRPETRIENPTPTNEDIKREFAQTPSINEIEQFLNSD